MREAIARHDALLHAAVDEHDGYVFATGGDGLAVAFARAGDAVRAAVAAQEALLAESWPAGASLTITELTEYLHGELTSLTDEMANASQQEIA